jgi:hypothetical protein
MKDGNARQENTPSSEEYRQRSEEGRGTRIRKKMEEKWVSLQ